MNQPGTSPKLISVQELINTRASWCMQCWKNNNVNNPRQWAGDCRRLICVRMIWVWFCDLRKINEGNKNTFLYMKMRGFQAAWKGCSYSFHPLCRNPQQCTKVCIWITELHLQEGNLTTCVTFIFLGIWGFSLTMPSANHFKGLPKFS